MGSTSSKPSATKKKGKQKRSRRQRHIQQSQNERYRVKAPASSIETHEGPESLPTTFSLLQSAASISRDTLPRRPGPGARVVLPPLRTPNAAGSPPSLQHRDRLKDQEPRLSAFMNQDMASFHPLAMGDLDEIEKLMTADIDLSALSRSESHIATQASKRSLARQATPLPYFALPDSALLKVLDYLDAVDIVRLFTAVKWDSMELNRQLAIDKYIAGRTALTLGVSAHVFRAWKMWVRSNLTVSKAEAKASKTLPAALQRTPEETKEGKEPSTEESRSSPRVEPIPRSGSQQPPLSIIPAASADLSHPRPATAASDHDDVEIPQMRPVSAPPRNKTSVYPSASTEKTTDSETEETPA